MMFLFVSRELYSWRWEGRVRCPPPPPAIPVPPPSFIARLPDLPRLTWHPPFHPLPWPRLRGPPQWGRVGLQRDPDGGGDQEQVRAGAGAGQQQGAGGGGAVEPGRLRYRLRHFFRNPFWFGIRPKSWHPLWTRSGPWHALQDRTRHAYSTGGEVCVQLYSRNQSTKLLAFTWGNTGLQCPQQLIAQTLPRLYLNIVIKKLCGWNYDFHYMLHILPRLKMNNNISFKLYLRRVMDNVKFEKENKQKVFMLSLGFSLCFLWTLLVATKGRRKKTPTFYGHVRKRLDPPPPGFTDMPKKVGFFWVFSLWSHVVWNIFC